MAETLRIGLIGLGGVVTRAHLPSLAARPDVTVRAGAEIDAYQRDRTQQRFGIPRTYATYQEMLEEEPLDAVYVCLPNALHYQAASAALDRGLHVYCEKPVGLCAQEAQDLAEHAERAGLVLMPGYHMRFHEHFLRARKLLIERRLGKILQIQASAVYSGPYRGWDPKSDWYFDPRSGGVLYDWGSHLLDLLVYVANLEIETVSAVAQKSLPGLPIADSFAASFRARRDIVGTLNLAWGTRGNLLMLQIHGTAGSLLVSDDYYEHRMPTGGGLNKLATLLANARELLTQKASAVLRRRPSDTLHARATRVFIEAIRGEVEVHNYKWDAVRVHYMLATIAAAVEHGGPVRSGVPRERTYEGAA
ncbi:MAG: Gfo/Idh/MocA family oxidoreductase [Chloroflexi bacterium]|mgnify:FL=1|nr:Gfo/Idh/MocA family oxidoreductase [Chloroflexota bacterium]